jgi:GntR family transcriptional regulator/MocR family aminotransferase
VDAHVANPIQRARCWAQRVNVSGLGGVSALEHGHGGTGLGGPMYRQLHERLRAQILGGQLEAGSRLPSTRTLAAQLGVSRTTTALAYELLLLEGYVESRVGDGTRVADLGAGRLGVSRSAGGGLSPAAQEPHLPWLARRGQLLVDASSPGVASADHAGEGAEVFRTCEPDSRHFPYGVWAKLLSGHARRSLPAATSSQDAGGYLPLREAIAAHIGVTRGIRCAAEQVLITSGARAALDLVSRVLLDPGDPAWVEDPGYQGTRGVLLAAGAQPVAVPVDREGIDVEAGSALCGRARLAVVTPSSQFPTGVTMSRCRRLALLEWAGQAPAWIVEGDGSGEYRYGGRPLEALQGLDRESRVISIGSFGRVLPASVRLGYLVAPTTVLEGLLSARRYIDVRPSPLEQLALADFIARGHYARHVQRTRGQYLECRDALVEALRRELGDLVEVAAPEAGTQLVAWLPTGVDGRQAARAAAEHGLCVDPVSRFSQRSLAQDGLVLGYVDTSPAAVRAGVATLACALRTVTQPPAYAAAGRCRPLPAGAAERWDRRGRDIQGSMN